MNPTASCGIFIVTDEPVDPVVLSVGDSGTQVGESGIFGIGMANNDPVAGFQFTVEISPEIASIVAVETTERTEGFTASSANGIVVAFSLTGDVVQPGTGDVLNVIFEGTDAGEANVCLDGIVLSDPSGNAMVSDSSCGSLTVSDGPIYGCTDELACNFDSSATEDNGSCDYESCAGCTDPDALNYDEDAAIDDNSCIYNNAEHFVIQVDETGESSLIIIQSALDLSEGDEIGLFDANGVTESCIPEDGCEDVIMGEVLVGSGVWTGGQLEIVGIGAVDLSDFGGPVLNGYVGGHEIGIRVWIASEDEEYDAVAMYSAGDGTWGAILTVIDQLETYIQYCTRA